MLSNGGEGKLTKLVCQT